MPLNLKGIFSTGAKDLVDSIGNAFDKNFTNKEELEAAKLELQKEVNRHLESMEATTTKEVELAYQDTADTRNREIEFIKATGHADRMQTFVGASVLIAFFTTLVMMIFVKLPESSEHVIITAFGILDGLTGLVVGYYFGSSAGSRIKDMKR
ncbi:MAG TPA: hypothetical protein VFO76_00765 [Candidatus Kapabacteria bacterium]|nr:hypothetical protein [Candidatus Kapabacteria bacterium]